MKLAEQLKKGRCKERLRHIQGTRRWGFHRCNLDRLESGCRLTDGFGEQHGFKSAKPFGPLKVHGFKLGVRRRG